MLWSADGTWERLVRHVLSAADAGGGLDWNINVDSTITRAHQHAAEGLGLHRPRAPGRYSNTA
ncbi:hypothetical protein CGZ69_35495 [Streptomyces peucetius subsp. caesius ATCC 27952]|nr:hypothetical protein CGZ69_35495 [Streptomyces peucetius subsp. caesius ATCC 27952]